MQSSAASFGVVPFENSSNGSVLITLDLLTDRQGEFPNTNICGETYLSVRHCLLGHVSGTVTQEESDLQNMAIGIATSTFSNENPTKSSSKPRTDFRHIKSIYSHPQALGQCEVFLSTYLEHAVHHEVSSTSEAARLVARDESCEEAAISSRFAAEANGLSVLAEGVQDVEDNTTRFLIIQKGPVNSKIGGLLPPKFHTPSGSGVNRKALVAFKIRHQTQGALANALIVFKNHDLNITSINNRPSRSRPWHYVFFVEFQGKKELEDPDLLRLALKDLDSTTEGNKWLGCWIDRFGL